MSPPEPIDRAEAARLLRSARETGPDADETIDWAFAAMPHSSAAHRLKVQALLRQGDWETADALLARELLQRPTHAGLILLRAQSSFGQGRDRDAEADLRLVLALRPEHTRALELAGRVALRLGHPEQAAAHFRAVDAAHPSDRIKELRVEALLAAGRPDLARGVLGSMEEAPPLTAARVLRAEGRALEAADVLAAARSVERCPDHAAITVALIDVVESIADARRLRHLLDTVTPSDPDALLRAGRAWLSLGEFRAAVGAMRRLSRVPGRSALALVILMVAAAMLQRPRLAARALHRLRHIDEPVARESVADAWCRGLLGRILIDQRSARVAGADPLSGRLGRLLGDAVGQFSAELTRGTESASRRRDLERHRDVCLGVVARLGEPRPRPAPTAKTVWRTSAT